MKKITLLLLLVIAMGMTVVAGPVDSTTAKNVALNFWRSQINPTRQDATNVQLRNVAPQLGFSQLYLMQNEAGEGFVIVAADDRAIPVLGYSDHGTLDAATMPDNFRMWLQIYEEEIAAAAQAQLPQSEETAAQWTALSAGVSLPARATTAVQPLLSTTWDQGSPYNSMCPGSGWSKCPTGCVATAMAQVM